jgi:hypothetical protein
LEVTMSDYVVIYERAEDGAWGAYLPDLPGVVAFGATQPTVDPSRQLIRSEYSFGVPERGVVERELGLGGDQGWIHPDVRDASP